MGPGLRRDDVVERVNRWKFVSGEERPYAFAMSGNTASILVFRVAALNGLTM